MGVAQIGRQLVFVLAALLWLPLPAQAASYEAPLPAELGTDPDMCRYLPCADVLPGAESFSPRKGRPAYVEAYASHDGKHADDERNGDERGDDDMARDDRKHGDERKDDDEADDDEPDDDRGELIGYVFLSTDIVDIPAYSGKPVVTLIGMDKAGRIVGVKILRHSEPILLVGIPESELTKFIMQFVGKNAWDKVEVGKARASGGYIGIDAISGATVTVIAQNQVVMRSAYLVARQVGIVKAEPKAPAVFRPAGAALDWQSLVEEGSIRRLQVSAADVGETDTREPLIDIHFGYLNEPTIGRSILGERTWQRLMDSLRPNDHAIFLIASGRTTFKGSGFVRGGIFDRLQVAQDIDTFTFRDTDYQNLYGIEAAGAPAYTESSVFIIRGGDSFSAAYPWSLVFLGNKLDKKTGQREFVNFDREYWLPGKYLEGGRPEIVQPEPTWVKVWRDRAVEIVLFTALLLFVATVYAFRNRLTRASNRHNKWPVNAFKYTAWVLSIGFIGFHLMAQPSVTQVLTWFHALLFKWTWELFLTDPFIFIFWIFIFVTVFLWGRGLFCGWLCPFGSLQELIYKISGWIGLRRFQRKLPMRWHNRLKWIKYVAFFVLLGVSFFSMGLAERMAEIEPFKTTFLVGIFNRAWPYTLFVAVLLGMSILLERPFCKYLCPLGAGLAMPTTFRWFGLKRKQECNTCTACAVGCGSLAIDSKGRIDQRECLLCLDCMVLYTDDHACPPLAQERKYREKNKLPLTPINAQGYFIPVVNIDAEPAPARRAAVKEGPDPRMPSDPVDLHYANQDSLWRFLAGELKDHLWPWSRAGLREHRAVQAAGFAVLLAAALVLLLAIEGRIEGAAVIAAWVGWSFFEVLVRMGSRPYVKEGPWWQRHYRVASWMDMVSYVGFKNLLIGAVLFVILKSMGLLVL
jgi:NosR/NirI family nitrous oxide reductase transcriptional regulator